MRVAKTGISVSLNCELTKDIRSVVKKNYWDHTTGKLNLHAIIQAAPEAEKRKIYDFLKSYFGDR